MFRPKQYIIELGGAFILYGVLLVGANAVERAIQPVGTLKLAINLVPMLGMIAAAWAILRGLWQMDEMQRRIQFDAIAIAFLAPQSSHSGGVLRKARECLTYAHSLWPIMGTLWGVGIIFAQRRYR